MQVRRNLLIKFVNEIIKPSSQLIKRTGLNNPDGLFPFGLLWYCLLPSPGESELLYGLQWPAIWTSTFSTATKADFSLVLSLFYYSQILVPDTVCPTYSTSYMNELKSNRLIATVTDRCYAQQQCHRKFHLLHIHCYANKRPSWTKNWF